MFLMLIRDNLLGLFIEHMNLIDFESELDSIARSCSGVRSHSCGDRELIQIKVQIDFCTQQLVYPDGGLKYAFRIALSQEFR